MRCSVFTVVMKEYDVATALQALAQWGYDGVEWRVHETYHLHPEGLVTAAPDIRRMTDEAGLTCCALAPYIGLDRLEALRPVFAGAQILGAPRVRVNAPRYDRTTPYWTVLDTARRQLEPVIALAAATGVQATLEIHMGNILCSASLARRLVDGFDPRHLGVIYDPGNMMYEGYENWRMGLECLGPYLAHVHVKNMQWVPRDVDAHGTLRWQPTWATMRAGFVNWAEVLADLQAVGYDGWLSLEDFSEVQSTAEKLPGDLAYLRQLVTATAADDSSRRSAEQRP